MLHPGPQPAHLSVYSVDVLISHRSFVCARHIYAITRDRSVIYAIETQCYVNTWALAVSYICSLFLAHISRPNAFKGKQSRSTGTNIIGQHTGVHLITERSLYSRWVHWRTQQQWVWCHRRVWLWWKWGDRWGKRWWSKWCCHGDWHMGRSGWLTITLVCNLLPFLRPIENVWHFFIELAGGTLIRSNTINTLLACSFHN